MSWLCSSNDANRDGIGYIPAVEPTDLDRRLAALDRAQLIELLHRLLVRHPDLEDLVHLPLTGERQRADAATVNAHVTRILMEMGDDWRASWRTQFDILPIVQIGDDYEKAGALADARTVYRAIIDAILAVYTQIRDEESEIAHVVEDCLNGLGRCLARTTDPPERERLLDDVFRVYRWDSIDHGSFGMDGFAKKVLLEQSTDIERKTLVRWLREALPSDRTGQHSRWGRQAAGSFMLELLGDKPDPKELEDVASAAHLSTIHADLLIGQGRMDEAFALLSTADRQLLAVANRLLAAGFEEKVVVARVAQHGDLLDPLNDDIRTWLAQHGVPTKGLYELSWQIKAFARHPTIGRYKGLREDATKLGWWPNVAPMLLQAVDNDASKLQPLRARALAAVGRWPEAMRVFGELPDSARMTAGLEMGGDAEAQQPALARELYEAVIARLRAQGTKGARAHARELEERVARMASTGAAE